MVVNGVIWVTEQDYNRLRQLLIELTRASRGMQSHLQTLEDILDLARIVHAEKMPRNVVTMNSRVRYEDARTGEESTVTIVYPAAADPLNGKISVLSPVGAALLGEAEGQEIDLPLPHNQTRKIRIHSVVYQPEAEGNYAL